MLTLNPQTNGALNLKKSGEKFDASVDYGRLCAEVVELAVDPAQGTIKLRGWMGGNMTGVGGVGFLEIIRPFLTVESK